MEITTARARGEQIIFVNEKTKEESEKMCDEQN
jgi:hypothetical protein